MAKCAYCGTTILFGGIKDNEFRFCNEKCRLNGYSLFIAKEIPQAFVEQRAEEIYRGLCPKCKGSGPVDVHTSHRVYSLLVYTSWKSSPNICCKSCGGKNQARDALFSFSLGWWGFPWGFIMTPIQVFRNIAGILKTQDETRPSEDLKQLVRISIAQGLIEKRKNVTV